MRQAGLAVGASVVLLGALLLSPYAHVHQNVAGRDHSHQAAATIVHTHATPHADDHDSDHDADQPGRDNESIRALNGFLFPVSTPVPAPPPAVLVSVLVHAEALVHRPRAAGLAPRAHVPPATQSPDLPRPPPDRLPALA